MGPLSRDLAASFRSVWGGSPEAAVVPGLDGLVPLGIERDSKHGRCPRTASFKRVDHYKET